MKVARPHLFFSYGMTKSGSTLAFELARTALESCSCPQLRFPRSILDGPDKKINFIQDVSEQQAREMLEFARELGYPLVLKTHRPPSEAVCALFSNGEAMGHAVYRDPRDMALSMIDHGRRARFRMQKAFSKIKTLEDAIRIIRRQAGFLQQWLAIPGITPIDYDMLAFDTRRTCEAMMIQLGIEGTASEIVEIVQNSRFTQYNKGVRDRYLTEMSQETSDKIISQLGPLMAISQQR